jgi:hypothetical protein
MGEIIGAAGQIAAASMQAQAVRDATQMQIDALNRQRQFVYQNLDPSVVNAQATQADINRALNQRALQAQIDPGLAAQRTQSETAIGDALGKIGQESGRVSNVAANEAIAGTPGMEAGKNQLVDQALHELSLGATLPPDVQAELVKAGLEKSGMVTGGASGQGSGGQILRTILGTAGLQLKAQRQQQAANLMTTAQNLEANRQNILQGLFPKLAQTQLANLGGAQGVLQQSNNLTPEAGLNGQSVANIWLSRVGATNQMAQQAANVGAQGAMGQGQIWGSALGGAATSIGNAITGWQNSNTAPVSTGMDEYTGAPTYG